MAARVADAPPVELVLQAEAVTAHTGQHGAGGKIGMDWIIHSDGIKPLPAQKQTAFLLLKRHFRSFLSFSGEPEASRFSGIKGD